MKTAFFFGFLSIFSNSIAQSGTDTSKISSKPVRSAWSQRPDTSVNKQPLSNSNQPFATPPSPPPVTNPTNNPTSGQTYQPNNEPLTPPVISRDSFSRKPKTIIPVKPQKKRTSYDTLPGTSRNG